MSVEDLYGPIGGGIGAAQRINQGAAATDFEVGVLSGLGVEAAHFLFEYSHQDAFHIVSLGG